MQTNTTFSTNKIIIFTVFVCAALMSSLFIFHLRNKPEITPLTPDEGILFPMARDIKSFELITADNKNFSQRNFYQHWTLLVFGFTHCASVCPTTMEMLKRAYANLHSQYPNLQVALISLDPDRDTPKTLAAYTHSFNPAFIGASGKIQDIHKLQSQLGIFSARDGATGNYQLQHTASILLINPEGKWAGMFKFGMNPEQFSKAFIEGLNFLSRAKSLKAA